MTYSADFRWRAVFLMHVYGVSVSYVSYIFGPKRRTLLRWYSLFLQKGVVEETAPRSLKSRWPEDVIKRVKQYINENPSFYLEGLQAFLFDTFPELTNVSLSTICRALNFDMNMSRKVLTKSARECIPREVSAYKSKLEAIYSYPEQLLFIDETSKDGRQAYRWYAWSRRNKKAVVKLPFKKGERRSILAALDHRGFVAWDTTPGTYTRNSFHRSFVAKIFPLLNPWPQPRSIVILDNAKIHMYKELEEVVFQAGARLLFLPPYAPHLNPIEFCFGLLKKWLQKNADIMFPLYPDLVLEVAMRSCCVSTKHKDEPGVLSLYSHCGYAPGALRTEAFTTSTAEDDDD